MSSGMDGANVAKPTVLVLDDEASVRKGVAMALAFCKCEAIEAATVAEALEAVTSQNIDLVIADLLLDDPGGAPLNGLEAIGQLRAAADRVIPSVILTGQSDAALDIDAGKLGIRVLPKPIGLKELETVVHDLLGR